MVKRARAERHNRRNDLSVTTVVVALGCMLVMGLGRIAAADEDFRGLRGDWASWIRDGRQYLIDDDPGLELKNGVVNDALLYLAFGKEAASSFRPGNTALIALREQMLSFAQEGTSFGRDHDRVLTSMAEAYLVLRDRDVFTLQEQRLLEEDLFRRWAYENAEERMGHQYVPHALAAVVGHVLATSRTGADYARDVERLWEYAGTAFDFGETPGPIENSAHYSPFVYISLARISIYRGGRAGTFPDRHKENLMRAVSRILDLYPHNGFGLSFGETWSRSHVRQLFSFLIGAACFLNDGDPEHVRLARQAKWMALKLFRFGFRLPRQGYLSEDLVDGQPGHTRGEPIWLWLYSQDDLEPLAPELAEHGSKIVYGDFGNSYDATMPHRWQPDKVVHRDGWGQEAFYLLVDLAPSCGKNKPYAGSIVNVVFGEEVFSPGKTRDRYRTEWPLRNVVDSRREPDSIGRTNASVGFFLSRSALSISRVDDSAGGWSRYISFPQEESYAVVFDFAPQGDVAYSHFLTDGQPDWETDGIVLKRGKHELEARFPNNLGWYEIGHQTVSTWSRPNWKDQVWYVDDPAESVEVQAPGAWLTVLYPRRGGRAQISALNPQQEGKGTYPRAAGVKIEVQGHTDWMGFQPRSRDRLSYHGKVETDAEVFWLREQGETTTVGFWRASGLRVQVSAEPEAVELDGEELKGEEHWSWEAGQLEVSPPKPGGVLRVQLPRPLDAEERADSPAAGRAWHR